MTGVSGNIYFPCSCQQHNRTQASHPRQQVYMYVLYTAYGCISCQINLSPLTFLLFIPGVHDSRPNLLRHLSAHSTHNHNYRICYYYTIVYINTSIFCANLYCLPFKEERQRALPRYIAFTRPFNRTRVSTPRSTTKRGHLRCRKATTLAVECALGRRASPAC